MRECALPSPGAQEAVYVCEALTCQEQPGCVGTTLHLWPVSRRASHHVVVDDLLEALAALFKAFLQFTKGHTEREEVEGECK